MKDQDTVLLERQTKVLKSVKEPGGEQDPRGPLPPKKKSRVKSYVGRFFLTLGLTVLFVLIAAVLTANMLLNGPSEKMRDMLVLSARQASATKWLPPLFIGTELTEKIERDSKTVVQDVERMDAEVPGTVTPGTEKDEWEDAIDGILYIPIVKPTFKAYLLMIRDPARVFVGISSDSMAAFQSASYGMRIFDIAEKYDAVAAINGGEFADPGGVGVGNRPMGITYSQGKLVWRDGLTNRTFIGITNENKLVVFEGMNQSKADSLGIRDGVCFQTGNSLITNDGENIIYHYADGDTGVAQRTCVGQRRDGTILFLVTDGRSADSLGATHNDLINLLREYGAVVAGKLDGGSSAMLYYRNYFELYNINKDLLDEYQRQGLVNRYKAFTKPRLIPTYFVVRKDADHE